MHKYIILPAIALFALTACEPTERTNPEALKEIERRAAATAAAAAAAAAQAEQQRAAIAVEAPAPVNYATSLLDIRTNAQGFNLLRPWEKSAPETCVVSGVYLGNGMVLTVGQAAKAATYVEIALPDDSRAVPGKVLRYDEDLNLALITVAHTQDASIFESRTPVQPASPMKLGDKADVWCTVKGLVPVQVPLLVESGGAGNRMPRLVMKVSQPLPSSSWGGLPIIRDGRLVAISESYQPQTQQLSAINAEFINRFLTSSAEGHVASAPVLGIRVEELDSPIFRSYLKLDEKQGGMYISRVEPGSPAEEAGIRKGDVLVAIEDLPLDNRGRCNHPLYGVTDSMLITRSYKTLGEKLRLSLSRNGEILHVDTPLNRDFVEKGLFREDKIGKQPRYVVWGGLLFQPLTTTYLDELHGKASSLPLEFLELKDRTKELRDKGYEELVGMTLVIPTAATQDYESLGFCMVEAVNGTRARNFTEFVALLEAPTANGITEVSLNKPPYKIYLDRQLVEQCNDALRRNAIPRLKAE